MNGFHDRDWTQMPELKEFDSYDWLPDRLEFCSSHF